MKRKNFREKCFERDDFTCQKCKFYDLSGSKLEAHHMKPLCFGGEDKLFNLITLCSDCHRFAPNKEKEFREYLQDECEGTLTTLIKAFEKVRKENPEFVNDLR